MSKAIDKAPFTSEYSPPRTSSSILSRYATPIYPPRDVKSQKTVIKNQERILMPDPMRDDFLGCRVPNVPCLGSSGAHEEYISILVSYS